MSISQSAWTTFMNESQLRSMVTPHNFVLPNNPLRFETTKCSKQRVEQSSARTLFPKCVHTLGSPPLNNIIGAHWTWHNRCQLHQILDRVPSKANIADPFSRGDFDIAHQHGWKILRTPHKEILQRTFKIIGDALFAHTTGFSNLSGLQAFHDMLWTWFLLLRSSTTGWTFDGTVQPRTFHELERKKIIWRKSSSLSWTQNMIGNSRCSETQLQERSVGVCLCPWGWHVWMLRCRTVRYKVVSRVGGIKLVLWRLSKLRGSKWRLWMMWTDEVSLEGHGHW